MEIALIDHYDSFTQNVMDWLHCDKNSYKIRRIQFDSEEGMKWAERHADAIVLSPGPKSPEDAKSTTDLVESRLGKVPILGICLGHQILGLHAGGNIKKCRDPWHGEKRRIKVTYQDGFFRDVPGDFGAAVYNSLTIDPTGFKKDWIVSAKDHHNEVQAIEYIAKGRAPAVGLQFHPESFMSEHADQLRDSFQKMLARS